MIGQYVPGNLQRFTVDALPREKQLTASNR
jgi:hypothetical protein